MSRYGVFDIIGPRMIGPSSSHTAGAAKLANLAWRIAGRDVVRARLILFGSFAKTGKGHGTDKALVAGLLGMNSDDDRLRFSMLLAEEAGIDVEVIFSDEERDNQNCVRIEIESSTGKMTTLEGVSIGGGSVLVTNLDGMAVRFTGELPTLILYYADSAGVISEVTALFAASGINIAFMRVSRKSKHNTACMVVETDAPIPEQFASEIRALDKSISEVRII